MGLAQLGCGEGGLACEASGAVAGGGSMWALAVGAGVRCCAERRRWCVVCRCADIVVWFGCIQVRTFAERLVVGVPVRMVGSVVVSAVCPSGPVFAGMLSVIVVCAVVVSSLAVSVLMLMGLAGTK